MQPSDPKLKRLLLIGGGHAHVFVLERLAMNPVPGLDVILVCRDTDTPYSGMLPGYVAGHYSYDDIHIDLARLAAKAGVTYINDSIIGLDPDLKTAKIAGRPTIRFDIASINVGSTPSLDGVPGAAEFACPVKPISQFLPKLKAAFSSIEQASARSNNARLICVGAGAGGVELIAALAHRFQQDADSQAVNFTLIGRNPKILPSHPQKVQRLAKTALLDLDVELLLGQGVAQVDAKAIDLEDGRRLPYDALIWVTSAKAAAWMGQTSLKTDPRGFIAVDKELRSLSHPDVFAAGDCAEMVDQPREKAGVFAVRQGKTLANNLIAAILGQPLIEHSAQSSYLSLISLGGKTAIASKGPLMVSGALMWRWKDHIDQTFMKRFNELPVMEPQAGSKQGLMPLLPQLAPSLLHPQCQGCGGKLASDTLSQTLAQVGLGGAPQDAAQLPGTEFVQSVDLITPPLTDLFVSGQITAAHALSDIYAEGGTPIAAQLIATIERQASGLAQDSLAQLIAGAKAILDLDQVALIGGHTAEGPQTSLGLSVTGHVENAMRVPKQSRNDQGILVLTKPLGSGTLFAGLMTGQTKGRWIDAILPHLSQSNRVAAQILKQVSPMAMTDVTGFGLAGHLREMLLGVEAQAVINPAHIPLFNGALELAIAGVRSSLFASNAKASFIDPKDALQVLSCDPQTSGGLLALIEPDAWPDLQALAKANNQGIWQIGFLRPRSGSWAGSQHVVWDYG